MDAASTSPQTTEFQTSSMIEEISSSVDEIAIAGIEEPTVTQYFATINAGQFGATAELFAEDGALLPPFESPVLGRVAIEQYLSTEAKNFILQPKQGSVEPLKDNNTEFNVTGRVQTPLFSVNVAWQIALNSDKEIVLVKIKLLAALKDLMQLRPERSAQVDSTETSSDRG